MTFFYDKRELLVEAFENRLDEADICHKIVKGLPTDMAIHISLGRQPKLDNLKLHMQQLEPKYQQLRQETRQNTKSKPNPGPSTGDTQGKSESTGGERPSLKDTYDSCKISQKQSPTDPSKMI